MSSKISDSDIAKQLEETTLTTNIEQQITPWDVHGEVVDGVNVGINYDKLMNQFGCQPLTPELIARFEKATGKKAHVLLRRGMFYCHRDFEKILDCYEQGKPFFLYTGRGPSSDSMHLGHMIPFLFCKYLQDVFDCYLVIQMTDDEKFLFKEKLKLEECTKYAYENGKDIIAVGFNPEKTFIFPDTKYFGYMFETIVKIQKLVNFNQASHVFGFNETYSLGQIAYPATQMAPCFSESFPHFFGGKKDVPCLIPYAIDQDPYFRICRDIAPRLKLLKPSSICSRFFPALQGFHSKMSASDENTAIFLTDTPAQIKNKINRYAFSGGQDTIELQRQKGANINVDIAYQYLYFFMEDDAELERIGREYSAGRMLTGEVKEICIKVIQAFVQDFQAKRAAITPETVERFMGMPLTERERKMKAELDLLRQSSK